MLTESMKLMEVPEVTVLETLWALPLLLSVCVVKQTEGGG